MFWAESRCVFGPSANKLSESLLASFWHIQISQTAANKLYERLLAESLLAVVWRVERPETQLINCRTVYQLGFGKLTVS